MNKKVLTFLLVLFSIGGMFYFSTQTAIVSSIQSQFFIDLIYKTTGIVIDSFIIRKLAHIFMFMMISLSMSLFIYNLYNDIVLTLFVSFIITGVYAMIDEYIQTFIDGRCGSLMDVRIDIIGIIIGLFISGGFMLWKRKRK